MVGAEVRIVAVADLISGRWNVGEGKEECQCHRHRLCLWAAGQSPDTGTASVPFKNGDRGGSEDQCEAGLEPLALQCLYFAATVEGFLLDSGVGVQPKGVVDKVPWEVDPVRTTREV
jgi:hypothetical protein